MPINLSDEHDDDLLPDGIYQLTVKIIPGGYGDDDILNLSKRGTLAYIKTVNIVVSGPHSGAEIWDLINVEHIAANDGGDSEQVARDKKTVKIGRLRARDILASAHAIDPETTDRAALKQTLTINSWGDLNGLIYWARVGIEDAKGNFAAKNRIERIITPADIEWPGSASQPAVPTRPVAQKATGTDGKAKWKDDMSDEVPF